MKIQKNLLLALVMIACFSIGLLTHSFMNSDDKNPWDSPEFLSVVRFDISAAILQEVRFADLELAPGVFLYTDIGRREGIHFGIASELGWSPPMLHRLDTKVGFVKSFLRSVGLGDVEVMVRHGTTGVKNSHFVDEDQRFEITTVAISFLRTPLRDTRKKL